MLKLIQQLKVFVLVTIAWVFFRAGSIDEAFQMIKLMFSTDFSMNITQLCAGKGPFNLVLSFLAVLFLLLIYFLPKDMRFKSMKANIAFLTVSIVLLFILSKDAQGEFIYFQF